LDHFFEQFVVGPDGPSEDSLGGPASSEAEALDAFSNVVVTVAGKLRPAVVNLRVERGPRGGSGSGVLFAPDGLLLTNHHVVGGAKGVRVRLHDGTPLNGPDGAPCYTPLMRMTSVNIDAAGNLWAVNNWKTDFATDFLPDSGNPGGDGIVIFVGVAAPPPRRSPD